MKPKWPIFIPSKGRADSRRSMKMFDALGVPYLVFVEPQEYDQYAAVMDPEKLHMLPHQNQGVTVTRNYMWDYAELMGYEWYWSFDDNIRTLYRFNHNLKTPCADGAGIRALEDFTERYENVVISGMNYEMFVIRRDLRPPYVLNTRVYSNMLIKTHAKRPNGEPYRFTTFYNEDTDICLRVLKDGFVTILFNAFLIDKAKSMLLQGGNTEFYKSTDKRREFAEELQRAHPDVVRVVEKYGRWHHQVNYDDFTQGLKRRPGLDIPRGVNNYGMVLEERQGGVWRAVEPTREAVEA